MVPRRDQHAEDMVVLSKDPGIHLMTHSGEGPGEVLEEAGGKGPPLSSVLAVWKATALSSLPELEMTHLGREEAYQQCSSCQKRSINHSRQ